MSSPGPSGPVGGCRRHDLGRTEARAAGSATFAQVRVRLYAIERRLQGPAPRGGSVGAARAEAGIHGHKGWPIGPAFE